MKRPLARAAVEDPQEQDQEDGPDGGADEMADGPNGLETDGIKDDSAEDGSDDPHDKVGEDARTASLHDLTGKPACRDTDQNRP